MKKIFAVVLLAVAFAMPSKAQFSWGKDFCSSAVGRCLRNAFKSTI